jgi:L-malate glycosyltransferase
MRITFVLPCYPTRPSGGLRIVYEYANELVDRGHEISIIHPAYLVHSYYGNNLKEQGRLPSPPIIDWQAINKKIDMKFVPCLREEYIPDSDAIIATAWYTADYVKDYSAMKGTKFYFIQSHEIWDGPENLVNQTWHYPLNKIVVSKWLMKIGEELGVSNMAYIPNAIDHKKFHIIVPIEQRPKKVGMLFSNQESKGAIDGLRALEWAKKEVPEIEAICYGVPKKNKVIPKWVKYIRTPTQKDLVEKIYNECSIFLCPSWIEGWGLPSTEAMACGCALISVDNGGVHDFAMHNYSALLSPIKDPRKLSNHIVQLIKDDEKRIQIAKNGLESIKKLSFNYSTNLLESYLESKISKDN